MVNVKVSADKQTDNQTVGQTDESEIICPGSINAGIYDIVHLKFAVWVHKAQNMF